VKKKNIKCPLCFMSFEHVKHLNSHLSVTHYKTKLLKYINLEGLKCRLCDANGPTFSTLKGLLNHVGTVHGKNKEFFDENDNHPSNDLEESIELKSAESVRDGEIEKTLQEDLYLSRSSKSSIDDLLESDSE